MIFTLLKHFQIEEDCKKLNFDHLSIFRPGLLGRGEDARFVEKVFGEYILTNFSSYIVINRGYKPWL
jgi:hypothetical protein